MLAGQGPLRVLDGMAGCGIRALRYGLEAGASEVWANDADPNRFPLLGDYLYISALYSSNSSRSSFQSTDDTSVSNLPRSWMWFFSRNKNDFFEFCYVNLIIT
jgi:tRNA G26 N,N-dimethylase Trm1